MATTSITLINFNLQKALNGHTIALSTDGTTLSNIIYNFKKTTASGYTGNDGEGNDYYFNAAGECSDSTKGNLKLVIAEASETSGTTGVRGEGKEEVTIDTLQPREQFAMTAMQGILNKIPCSILELDEATCLLVAQKSFVIAQYMINTAAEYRAKTQSSTPPDQVTIDNNTLNSVSDKILYNIWQSTKGQNSNLLKKLDTTNTNLSNVNTSIINGLKKLDTTNTNLSNINTSITNGNNGTQKVSITNTPNVNVANTPYVNIDNTPNVIVSNVSVPVSGSVRVSNMLSEPVDVRVTNMLSEPVDVNVINNSLNITGNVDVDNMLTEPVLVTNSNSNSNNN